MLPAANVTARQRGRRSGGAPRLAAAVLLLALLALCCLGRADAVASLGTHPSSASAFSGLGVPGREIAVVCIQIRAYHASYVPEYLIPVSSCSRSCTCGGGEGSGERAGTGECWSTGQ